MSYVDFLKRTAFFGTLFMLAIALSSYHLHGDWFEVLEVILVIPILFAFLFYFEIGGIIVGFLSSAIYLVISILYRTEFTDVASYYISLSLPTLIFVFLGFGGGRIASFVRGVSVELEQQRLLSTITGLYTKEYLANLIQRHICEYERYESPFSIILLEVTKSALQSIKPVKRENLLIKIGLKLRESVRMIDEVARYENQYLLVLPHTPLEGSKIADKRVKKTIGQILEEDRCALENSEAVYSITVAYPENKENVEKLLEALRSSAIVATP